MENMFATRTKARRMMTLVSFLLLIFTLAACIAPDEPLVLSSEGDAVEEGAVAVGTPGQEPAVAIGTVDADALATGQPTGEATEEVAEDVATVPAEGETTDEGLAAEIGFTDVLVSANYLVNVDVRNTEGDVIADVDDLLLDLNTGRILYVVVNYGDFLDLTDEDRPIPLSAFGWSQDLELVLRLPEETLESVPAVSDEWPLVEDTEWNGSALAYWQDAGFALEFDAETAPVRVTELVGLHAGQTGAELGVVEDFLLDLSSEQVAYVGIFTTDGFYSPDLVLLVPLAAADLTIEIADNQALYGITLLEVDPEVLRAAPALDRSLFSTANFIDQSFTQELNTYWREQGVEVGGSQ
jgi:sporulation protein YlmC with PRC-barrel domain